MTQRTRWLLAGVLVLTLALWLTSWLPEWLDIDRCLDSGGAWNDEADRCER